MRIYNSFVIIVSLAMIAALAYAQSPAPSTTQGVAPPSPPLSTEQKSILEQAWEAEAATDDFLKLPQSAQKKFLEELSRRADVFSGELQGSDAGLPPAEKLAAKLAAKIKAERFCGYMRGYFQESGKEPVEFVKSNKDLVRRYLTGIQLSFLHPQDLKMLGAYLSLQAQEAGEPGAIQFDLTGKSGSVISARIDSEGKVLSLISTSQAGITIDLNLANIDKLPAGSKIIVPQDGINEGLGFRITTPQGDQIEIPKGEVSIESVDATLFGPGKTGFTLRDKSAAIFFKGPSPLFFKDVASGERGWAAALSTITQSTINPGVAHIYDPQGYLMVRSTQNGAVRDLYFGSGSRYGTIYWGGYNGIPRDASMVIDSLTNLPTPANPTNNLIGIGRGGYVFGMESRIGGALLTNEELAGFVQHPDTEKLKRINAGFVQFIPNPQSQGVMSGPSLGNPGSGYGSLSALAGLTFSGEGAGENGKWGTVSWSVGADGTVCHNSAVCVQCLVAPLSGETGMNPIEGAIAKRRELGTASLKAVGVQEREAGIPVVGERIAQAIMDEKNAVQSVDGWGKKGVKVVNTETGAPLVYQMTEEQLKEFQKTAQRLPTINIAEVWAQATKLEGLIQAKTTSEEKAMAQQLNEKYPDLDIAAAYLARFGSKLGMKQWILGLPNWAKDRAITAYVGQPAGTDKLVVAINPTNRNTKQTVANAPSAVIVLDNGPAEQQFVSNVLKRVPTLVRSLKQSK